MSFELPLGLLGFRCGRRQAIHSIAESRTFCVFNRRPIGFQRPATAARLFSICPRPVPFPCCLVRSA